jgi:hypothetical protein
VIEQVHGYDNPVPTRRRDLELMTEAIEADADGQRALLAARGSEARDAFRAASELYRESWEHAPPRSYGRLVGMLKAAILADEGKEAARYARAALASDGGESSTAAYAEAIAALALGDDCAVADAVARLRDGSDALGRTADALAALAEGDQHAYTAALEEIVTDFEQRTEHLTGVAIADTAVMLERLAAPRGMTTSISSPLLPRDIVG